MNKLTPDTTFKKILVIDDNEIDLYIAETCILNTFNSTEVITEQSAEKALEYLLSLKDAPDKLPDLIFLDIRMPVMDGFGFLEEYEKLPESLRRKAITMLSSSLNEEDHERAAKSNFVENFIIKPLNKEKLKEIISNKAKLLVSQKAEATD